MSDNIPLEIQMEIIQRIPDIKSVIRCRSVSKAWKSVIDSKDFVTAHTLRHQAHNRHHLLIGKGDRSDKKVKYVSILDDDTFPNQKLNVFVPDSLNKFSSDSEILGTSLGLFCLYEREADTAVIWNPSIRKTVSIEVPNKCDRYFGTVIGFGLCPSNFDPKLVKITYVYYPGKLQDVNTRTHVEVFTLSSGGWRSPLSSNVPYQSIKIGYSQAVIDGVIYWKAVDRYIRVGDRFRNPNLIMSFDLTSEEFTKVNLPDPLTLSLYEYLLVFNLRESLVVLKFNMCTPTEFCDVWMMIGHGCTRSFNKLYSISAPDASIGTTVGFRKSGEPIIEYNRYTPNELAIYEPESKTITNIGIPGLDGTFFVHSYMETLLLLGH